MTYLRRINWRRVALICGSFGALMGLTLTLFYWTYDGVRNQARQEELTFWKHDVAALTPLDRSALLNYIDATGEVPNILPWWELDEDRCSATVTKYVAMFTGIELVHASAWKIRHLEGTVNARKLISRWEGAQRYNGDGTISADARADIVDQVKHLDFDPNKVYMIGLLWSHTRWWDVIQHDSEDINSHVALYTHGKVIHFIHIDGWGNPLKVETLDELFASGDLAPVWVSEVAQKSKVTSKSHQKLVDQPFALPATKCTLSFRQHQAPWWLLDLATSFPGLPGLSEETNASLDTFVEKSVLQRLANWGPYNMYPTFDKEATCAE